eukprot:12450003-Alexandrium_andersonii.AAC.1
MARVRANMVAELVVVAPLAMAEIPGHGQGIADARAIGKPPTICWRRGELAELAVQAGELRGVPGHADGGRDGPGGQRGGR